MLLGTVLDRLSDEAVALQTLIGLEDISLLAKLNAVAADHDLTLGQTITRAVNNYTKQADADSWVHLVSVVNRAEDPGREALKLMLEDSLARH